MPDISASVSPALRANSLSYLPLIIGRQLTLHLLVQTQKIRNSWGGPILVHGKWKAHIKNECPKAEEMEAGAAMHSHGLPPAYDIDEEKKLKFSAKSEGRRTIRFRIEHDTSSKTQYFQITPDENSGVKCQYSREWDKTWCLPWRKSGCKFFEFFVRPWARVGYEMVNSQRGATRLVGYNQSHIQRALME